MRKAALSGSMRSIHLPFDWIDILVVPVTTSIMEAQPFAVVLLFFSLLLTGNSVNVPLNAVSIVLLMLGLQWWAQVARYLRLRGLGNIRIEVFQLLGLLLALALTMLTYLALLNNALVLLLVVTLVLCFWVRGRRRAQGELTEAQVLFSFKLYLTVLIAVLLITIPVSANVAGTMLAAIAVALPLFFLSGLMALSFLRLSATQHENRRDAFGTHFDRSRAWSLFLALTWTMLVVVTILVESFAFQPLLTLLTPLINAVELFLQSFRLIPPVVHLRVRPTPTPQKHIILGHGTSANLTLNPLIFLVIFVILGIIVLVGFLFILVSVLLARDKRREEEFENLKEERETLNVRSTLNERRKREQQRKMKFRLETLDPNSVRARYRDLLLATARHGGNIQRRSNETPAEYQQRLLALVAALPNKEGEPPNADILNELTEAYTLERYGRKQTAPAQVRYLKKWVQLLVKRIKGKPHPRHPRLE
jgi:hypothetical protein